MIPYILYVALITAICFLFYRLLLCRETFFRLNRWFFLGCLFCSFVLPLLHVPGEWSLRTQITAAKPVTQEMKEEPLSTALIRTGKSVDPDPVTPAIHNANVFSPHNASKERVARTAFANAQVRMGTLVKSQSTPVTIAPEEGRAAISLSQVLKWLSFAYIAGIFILGFSLFLQVIVLVYQVRNNPVTTDGLFRIVQTRGERAPCSFGHFIFINPHLYDEETCRQILSHEKIHVQQRHSLDIMLAELCIVIQWFNPFAWFYRKALEENLEFLTDAAIVRDPHINPSRYQMSLLRVSAPQLPLSITSNYNQSLLKKRLIMMHAQKSSVRTTWKYLFLLPVLTGLVCLFNDTKAVSQNTNTNQFRQQTDPAPAIINVQSAGIQVLPVITSEPDARAGISATAPTRNIAAVEADVSGSARLSAVTIANPVIADPMPVVNPGINIYVNPNISIDINRSIDDRKGSWMATIYGDTVELTLRSEGTDGHRDFSTNTETFLKSDFSSLPTGQKADFTVTREAGTLHLNGVFDGNEGFGHYTFNENAEFRNYLEKAGVTGITDRRMFGIFCANVKKGYVEELGRAGYAQLSVNNLIGLSAMKVDIAYIESWKQLGYTALQPHDLIALKSLNIDGQYLKELQNAGFKDIQPHELISAKSVGIDAAYAQTWKQAGFTDLSVHDLVAAKSVGIDPAYMESWKQSGFKDLSMHELISAKSVGIDPAYVQSWKQTGFNDLSIHDLISAKSVGIDPAYIQTWKQAGFNDLSIHDLVAAKSVGIDPAYAQSWKKIGFNDLSIHELIALKSQDISGSYFQSWKAMGYTDLSAHELVALKSVGVDDSYLMEMKDAGYPHMELHELIAFRSEGVTPGFIKGFQSLGFKDIAPHTIIEMKSMGVTPDYISSMKTKGFKSNDLQEYIKLKTFR